MDLNSRIQLSEQKFDSLEKQRGQLLKQAEECLTEMTKLQGEYRVLIEMRDSEKEKAEKRKNKQADTVEAPGESK